MMPRGPDIVRSLAGTKGRLGRDEDLIAPAGNGRAEDLLRRAAGVDVGAVEHVDPGFEADVDEPRRLGHVAAAPGFEQLAFATKGAGAKSEDRDLEPRAAELPVFHMLLGVVDLLKDLRREFEGMQARRVIVDLRRG